jgi:hypothetical protein
MPPLKELSLGCGSTVASWLLFGELPSFHPLAPGFSLSVWLAGEMDMGLNISDCFAKETCMTGWHPILSWRTYNIYKPI